MNTSKSLDTLLSRTPVLPVVTIDDASNAVPLARALVRGGINAIEVTLRTTEALEAINLIATQLPDMLVGAGTVLSPRDLQACTAAGAVFAVSPGATPALLNSAHSAPIPLLPGISTTSDIMAGIEHGFEFFKFFPASACGGVEALKAFAGPFAQLRFCPTGGITLQTAPSYLALKNVVCIGGSWITPTAAIQKGDWQTIERLAREAVAALRST
jgi:2-dehydro-3-deoxyphosphogluconate aldolase/(4S)-4-hydroxy-2-oxoglutarate aldolase